MDFVIYYINFSNFEQQDVEIQLQDFDTYEDPPTGTINIDLEGSENPVILESVENDDDKTKVIKGRRLTVGFNSDDYSVDDFSDGDDGRFLTRVSTAGGLSVPFIGNIVLDDNTEAFQPKPNPVRMFAGEGLGILKNIKLRESDGDVPRGHYRIIDYIYLCLRNLIQGQSIYVAMNLYEKSRYRKLSANFNVTATNVFRIPYDQLGFLEIGDTIEIRGSSLGNDVDTTVTNITENAPTSIDIEVSASSFVLETTEVYIFRSNNHTFFDVMLEATTFETDANEREDCYTVLNNILDAFGCSITYDNGGWYIIRWDEYDVMTHGASILKFAKFSDGGIFQNYEDIDVSKFIAYDQDPLYEGYRLSMDNGVKRFQRRAHSVTHTYKLEQPSELPCNNNLLSGTVDDDVLPLKTYIPDCWELRNEFGSSSTSTTCDLRIWVRYDDNDVESERYLVMTPSASPGDLNYARSEAIEIIEKDKFEFSFDYSADSDNNTDGPASIFIGGVVLYGDDGSVWVLGDNATTPTDAVPEWKLSNADLSVNRDLYQWFFSSTSGAEDYTEFKTYSIEAPPAPTTGKVYVHLFAANQLGGIDDFAIRYNNIRFDYIPLINGTYGKIVSQQATVTGDNDSRKNIEHEMFLGESGKKLFKGTLKKFDGTNYVLTETWRYLHNPEVLPDAKLYKHILYQWWNQFRKTRTVIETDIQGLKSSDGIPGMIHRWRIMHGGQEAKQFMLTSFRDMNFKTCGWNGVFVENSSSPGDRNYDDTFEFKYIQ